MRRPLACVCALRGEGGACVSLLRWAVLSLTPDSSAFPRETIRCPCTVPGITSLPGGSVAPSCPEEASHISTCLRLCSGQARGDRLLLNVPLHTGTSWRSREGCGFLEGHCEHDRWLSLLLWAPNPETHPCKPLKRFN